MSDPRRIGLRVPRGVLLGTAQAVGRTGAFCSRPGATLSAVPDSLPAQPAAVSSRSWERHGLGCVCPPVSCMPPPGARGGRRWLRGGASSGPRHSVRTWSVPGAAALGGYWRVRGRATLGARLEMVVSVGTGCCRSSWRTVCKSRRARRVLVSCTARCGRGPGWRRARPWRQGLGAVLLGALPDRLPVSQCLRLKRVARRPAPTMASLITRSWYSRMRLPSIPLVVVRIMPGGVAVAAADSVRSGCTLCSMRGRLGAQAFGGIALGAYWQPL